MTMVCETNFEPEGIVKKLSGYISDAEVQHMIEGMSANARFDDAKYVIVDASEVTGYEISQETIEYGNAVKTVIASRGKKLRIAVIVKDASLASLVLGSITSNSNPYRHTSALVDSMDEARAWVSG